jgi:hypothetical protein
MTTMEINMCLVVKPDGRKEAEFLSWMLHTAHEWQDLDAEQRQATVGAVELRSLFASVESGCDVIYRWLRSGSLMLSLEGRGTPEQVALLCFHYMKHFDKPGTIMGKWSSGHEPMRPHGESGGFFIATKHDWEVVSLEEVVKGLMGSSRAPSPVLNDNGLLECVGAQEE